jgi:hypothetical protein
VRQRPENRDQRLGLRLTGYLRRRHAVADLFPALCRIRENDDMGGSDDRPPRGELAGVNDDDLANRPAFDLCDVPHCRHFEARGTQDSLETDSTLWIGGNQQYLWLFVRTHPTRCGITTATPETNRCYAARNEYKFHAPSRIPV